MARIATAVAALVGGALAGEPAPNVAEAFEQWMAQYGKNYAGAEHLERFTNFERNYAYINEENAKGHSYSLGLNSLADLSAEEFSQRLGLRPRQQGGAFNGLPHLGTHARGPAELPKSVDWRDKAVGAVKDQGQCGSCWAFSTTGALEGAWEVATGKLLSLSEQQLVDCSTKNQGCGGGSMDLAFAFEEDRSVCTEESYSYDGLEHKCHDTACTAGIPAGGVVGFKDVQEDSMEALMDAVAQQPVAVAIEADTMNFQLYTGGILTGKCGTNLDHGVLLVGYGEEDGQKYWLVKNSWGSYWGDGGYIKLARDGDDVHGMCGIEMMASYPVVKAASEEAIVV